MCKIQLYKKQSEAKFWMKYNNFCQNLINGMQNKATTDVIPLNDWHSVAKKYLLFANALVAKISHYNDIH
jgi:hypothetical protein